jgi:hypothetical protein
MHGMYGFFWLLKDLTFPNKSFQKKVSIIGALVISLFWPLLGYGGY